MLTLLQPFLLWTAQDAQNISKLTIFKEKKENICTFQRYSYAIWTCNNAQTSYSWYLSQGMQYKKTTLATNADVK